MPAIKKPHPDKCGHNSSQPIYSPRQHSTGKTTIALQRTGLRLLYIQVFQNTVNRIIGTFAWHSDSSL